MVNKTIDHLKKNWPIYTDILFAIFFTLGIMYKAWYFQNSAAMVHQGAEFLEHDQIVFDAIMFSTLLITAIVVGIFKKHKIEVFFILSAIIGFWLCADTVYFRYYSAPTSISMIYQLSFLGDISASTGSLFVQRDWLFFLDLPIYIIAIALKIIIKAKTKHKEVKFNYIYRTIAIPLAIIFIFTSINNMNQLYDKTLNAMFNYDKTLAAKDLGIVYYHFYDIKQIGKDEIIRRLPINKKDREFIDNYFADKQKSKPDVSKWEGIAKDRNIIILQCEALQSIPIEKSINGEEITPFLNNLIKDSAYFTNMYHQVAGGNTVDAEFMMNNSLYPIKSGAVYFRYSNNEYFSLPYYLNNKDYNCYAAHAYKPSFWNRLSFYPNEGFNNFFSMNDYELDEKVGWALSDESFFRQNLDMIDKKNPYYLFNVTLSNHHPYDGFMHFDNINIEGYENTQLGNFIRGSRYTDACIKKLFDDLKSRGLYDNSIIIIYGDHSALFRDQKDDVSRFMDFEYNEFEWKKIQQDPFIIHVANSELKTRVDNVCGQIDMLPTLANLMGIDMPYTLGKDMLNLPNNYGYAVLRNGSVITDDFMYLTDFDICYDMKTGNEIDKSLYTKQIDKLLDDLKISDIIIGKNYFKLKK